MSGSPDVRFPLLYVEGKNDLYVVANLMAENGLTLTSAAGPVIIVPMDSVDQLLEIIPVAVKSAFGRKHPVGFVLDYDTADKKRWAAVKSKLKAAEIVLSDRDVRRKGIVKDTKRGRIGVWLMPYPQAGKGKLEDFLRELVPARDRVLGKAQDFVKEIARTVPVNERFRDIDKEKAEIATWLAVQDPPGNPYGTAIRAHTFQANRPLAIDFVNWFRELYKLS